MDDSRLEIGGSYATPTSRPRFLKGIVETVSDFFVRKPAWQPLAKDEEELGESSLHERTGKWCPEENAGWFSRMLFLYVNGLMRKAMMKTLQPDDLWDVCNRDLPSVVATKFEDNLSATRLYGSQGVVWRAICREHGRSFMFAGAIKLFHDVVMVIGPFLLEFLLKGLEQGKSRWVLLGLATGLALSNVLECLSINWYFHILYRIGLHLKIALITTLHRKSLRITSASRIERGAGTIVTLMSNDAAKIWNLPQYIHMLWSGPFQILTVLALLVRIIHLLPAAAGLAVTLCLIPLSTVVANRLAATRKELMQHTDRRVKLCSEVMSGIKAIKLYAWEKPYQQRIQEIRDGELVQVKRMAVISIFNSIIFLGGTTLISIASFSVYALMGFPLTAAVAFPALALFNLLRFPVMVFPSQIAALIQGHVALRRIQGFIEEEEMKQEELEPAVQPPNLAILLQSASFAWEAEGRLTLRNVNLQVGAGQLVAVVGMVGGGKSSLLNALLGEMRSRGGFVSLAGTTAYTAQDPWIQNATVKENILMGRDMDKVWYDSVISACALGPDLEMLVAGDSTEIGEKGVNLSGGQKHRVALARACYAAADVYLLDDPLSAVDAHVGRHLFNSCICGLLKGCTRVLVTHQMHFLSDSNVDHILVVQDGNIIQSGTYADLVAQGVDFHQYEYTEPASVGLSVAEEGNGGALLSMESIKEEVDVDQAIDGEKEVEMAEFTSVPGNCQLSERAALVLDHGHQLDPSGSPSTSSDDGQGHEESRLLDVERRTDSAFEDRRLGQKDGDTIEEFVSISIRSTANPGQSVPSAAGARGSQNLASAKIIKDEEREEGVVKRQMYLAYLGSWGPWFWVPIIVLTLAAVERSLQVGQNAWLAVWSNATSRAEAAGYEISAMRYLALYFILGMLSLGMQIGRSYSAVLGTVHAARRLHAQLLKKMLRLPMSFFDSQPVGRLVNRFSRDVEALDVKLGDVVISCTNCLVAVLGSILVVMFVTPGVLLALIPLFFLYWRVQTAYITASRELKRLDSVAMSPIFSSFGEVITGLPTIRAFRRQPLFKQRCMDLVLDSNRIYWPIQCVNRWLSVRLEMVGIFVVFGTAVFSTVLLRRSAGIAGLAITSALNLTGLLNWFVRVSSELEVNMNSVERVLEYETTPAEAAAISMSYRPPRAWPQNGAITVEGLVVKYRPDLDPVLRGITFAVSAREKIGIAGRTGCGKSTLILALYRIVEPIAGRIIIDSVDICKIGLFDLRSRMALVPQDPVVFSGTVRSNLDPFGTCSMAGDAPLWGVLSQVGLAAMVQGLPGELDAVVSEGGANISTGQRQLLCMARALLRNSRILVLGSSRIENCTDLVL
eukprot:jgi/Botrbrau1/4529/Bobra.60_2s0019.2